MAKSAQSYFDEARELETSDNPNLEEVIKLYNDAIDLGHVGAMNNLAILLFKHGNQLADEEKAHDDAWKLLIRAAFDHQHRGAMLNLAKLYSRQAELSPEQLDDTCVLAELLLNLNGTKKEKDENAAAALPLLERAVHNGHVAAMHVLADEYLKWDVIQVGNIGLVSSLAKCLRSAEGTEEEKEQNSEKAIQLLDEIFEKITQADPCGDQAVPEHVGAMRLLADLYLAKHNIEIEDLQKMHRLAQWLTVVQGTEEEEAKNGEKAARLSSDVLGFYEDLIKSGDVEGSQMYVNMFLEDFDAYSNYHAEALSKIHFKVFTLKNVKLAEYLGEALLTLAGNRQTKNEQNIYEYAVKLYGLAAHWGSIDSRKMCLQLYFADFDVDPEKMCDTAELSMICQRALSWEHGGCIDYLLRRLSKHPEKISEQDLHNYVNPLSIKLEEIRRSQEVRRLSHGGATAIQRDTQPQRMAHSVSHALAQGGIFSKPRQSREQENKPPVPPLNCSSSGVHSKK